MSSHNIKKVNDIISKTTKAPKIVNTDSKFVVATYWWGRGNYNANTARPCVAYYEQLIQKALKYIMKSINSMYLKANKNTTKLPSIIDNTVNIIFSLESYRDYLNDNASEYISDIYKFCKISKKQQNAEEKLLQALEQKKQEGITPSTFTLKSKKDLVLLFHTIIQEVVIQNKADLAKLIEVEQTVLELKDEFNKILKVTNRDKYQDRIDSIKAKIDKYNEEKAVYKKNIIQSLKTKKTMKQFNITQQQSIFDILNANLRYLNPLKFEEMIAKWERICEENKCNYLTVEYPEFAQPGGYQLAINAKPTFIKKALALCGDRAVVYIDGDMFVRKYPMIFDIPDVDFMARGWWMDPRAGGNFAESIVYDPYMFETSGGIMYFSQSKNAKFLIDKWIEVSDMPSQAGKADDRIISLIFNSYKLLLSMKIIQLPIEYLWLTMRYDDPLLEYVYDYNESAMIKSIIVEHPECLTSEETAAGAGASSDRTPKYYDFIGEEHIVPVSEMLHEYLMFPNKEMTEAFKDYFKYMNNITYLDDGSEYLIKRGFVNPEDPDYNESPLYIVPYDKKLGDKKSPEDEEYSFNEISTINLKRAAKMQIDEIPILINHNNNIIEIRDDGSYNLKAHELISLIIRLIVEKKTVIYNPVKEDDYDEAYYNKLIQNIDGLYDGIECGFVPFIKNTVFSDFFKPGIDISQVMLFRGGNSILTRYLSMFLSLEAFSAALSYGSYEFISRVSVGYIKKDRVKKKPELVKPLKAIQTNLTYMNEQMGGNRATNFMNEYEYALENMAHMKGGKLNKKSIKTRRNKKYIHKRRKTNKKHT